ncbi:MAG: DsbA family protein [Candidatus Nanohaloarchaea archaeon]
MTGQNKCEKCGESFDSERGLHIHQSQMHEEQEMNQADEKLEFGVRTAMFGVFILGIFVGLSSGLVFSEISDSESATSVKAPEKLDQRKDSASKNDSNNNRVKIKKDMLEGEPSLGNADAPITIVEYSDFGCPWCAEWAGFEAIPDDAVRVTGTIDDKETVRKIKQNYVQKGKARFVFKDYPVKGLHPKAPSAHRAANCVFKQDEKSFWKFHDLLFENRDEWKNSRKPLNEYLNYAENTAINVSEFENCYINSNNSEAEKDKRQIKSLAGRLGTPAIFIGNTEDGFVSIQGAQPYSSLKNVIEAELERARK